MTNNIKKSLKRYEIIKLGSQKYLVWMLKTNYAELLPISSILDESIKALPFIPKMKIEYSSMVGHKKINEYELYCLMSNKHPLIKKAIEEFLNERKKSR